VGAGVPASGGCGAAVALCAGHRRRTTDGAAVVLRGSWIYNPTSVLACSSRNVTYAGFTLNQIFTCGDRSGTA
jgi:hypothetical protein